MLIEIDLLDDFCRAQSSYLHLPAKNAVKVPDNIYGDLLASALLVGNVKKCLRAVII